MTPFQRRVRFTTDQHHAVLSENMAGVTISVTTRCNLGCDYCIFGGNLHQTPGSHRANDDVARSEGNARFLAQSLQWF